METSECSLFIVVKKMFKKDLIVWKPEFISELNDNTLLFKKDLIVWKPIFVLFVADTILLV